MTREEFLSIDWNDSHITYDITVGNYRTIAYLTISNEYPNSLCLVTGSKKFPTRNSGCGIHKNPCPYDILYYLKTHKDIEKIIVIMDDIAYDIVPNIIDNVPKYINGIDMEILFPIEKIE